MYSPRRMAARASRIDRSIAIVGMMGAGKSTVGRRLAKRLSLPFADADDEIEKSCGYTVAEIFDRFGESTFREGERRVIARLAEGPPRVIATGGGAFAEEATRRLILERCITIWLDADVETLLGRLGRLGHRPLLKGRDPAEAIAELAAKRTPLYAEAHIRIPTGTAPHAAIVDSICREIGA